MPRINRVRLHNIHYGKEKRVMDNLIFDLRGRSSLLILENGGGKTLILQLIAQVVCPNASLGKRRLATLVQNNPFTGHVLVEWILDGNTPAYILTGFCFAENTGSANRDMDYFNYISSSEYNQPHPWDMELLPLVDEDGRTLNYRELRERLNRSGRFRIYASERRGEYQRTLQTYNINPREWERVLETNSDEGGVGKFFENCSKTRSLLEKLLIPAIDSVLGRSGSGAEDDLAQSFQQASGELMHLPEFQAHMQSLNKLGEQIEVLQRALTGVEGARGEVDAALAARQSLYNTLFRGIPRLTGEYRVLTEALQENCATVKKIEHLLESVRCEGLRRSLEALQSELNEKERGKDAACRHLAETKGHYNRLRAWDFYGRWLHKSVLLKEEEAKKQRLLQGHESVAKEIDSLRLQLWPLLCTLHRALREASTTEESRLEALKQEGKKVAAAGRELEENKQSNSIQQARLEEQSKQFVKERDELAALLREDGLDIDLSAPEQTSLQLEAERQRAEGGREEWAQTIRKLSKQQEECSAGINTLSRREGELDRGVRDLGAARGKWQQEMDRLRELLALAGLEWLFPPEDFIVLQGELEVRRQQSEQALVDLELESNRLRERQNLLRGKAGPVPNNDILLLQETLQKQGVDTITGALFLRNLPGDEERERLARSYPWIPYALIAEQGQLQRMMRRSPELKISLSAPVPVAVRSGLERLPYDLALDDTLLCFFHNQGMEPFISPGSLDATLYQLEEQLEQLAVRREQEQGRNKQIRDAYSILDNILTNYDCRTMEEWEKRLQDTNNALVEVRRALEDAKNENRRLKEELEGARREESKVQQHLAELRKLGKRLDDYNLKFREEQDRRTELAGLQQSFAEIEAKLATCEGRKEEIGKEIEDLQERHRATHYKMEELDRDKRDLYLSIWDHPEQFISGEASWDDYRTKAGKLRASIDALNREIASLEDIENRIKGYKDDMDKLQGDIQETGLDFEDVKNSYRTVSKQELGACRQEVKEREAALQEAEQAFQEAGKRIEKEKGGWENECRRIMERYGHEPADLKGVDLESYSQELEAEKGNLTGRIAEQEKRLNLLWQLQQEYQDQTEALSAEGLELTEDPGWEPEREEKELACDARAPRRAVRDAYRALDEALLRLEEYHAAWHRVVDSCWQDLGVLNNLDINHIFRQLKDRTAVKGWEKDAVSVRESLCHVGRVINKAQEELERRLADLDRIQEEIVDRAYRHVDNILEELKTFQRMSRVELRGESIPLIGLDLRRPGADEEKELVHKYLADVIADAVRRRQEGESKDNLQQYLEGAVRSAALLEQLVPLDGIRFTVLKPRSDDKPYQSSDYDRWENLTCWSGGQRYIGRFAVFVALMSYLRRQSGQGQRTSVIIADNPFGEASSGHILEILNALTRQAKVQIFCVTAHRQTGIMKDFSVIYSLVARPTLSGQQRMIINPERLPGTMEAALGLVEDAGKPSWNRNIDGQLKLF